MVFFHIVLLSRSIGRFAPARSSHVLLKCTLLVLLRAFSLTICRIIGIARSRSSSLDHRFQLLTRYCGIVILVLSLTVPLSSYAANCGPSLTCSPDEYCRAILNETTRIIHYSCFPIDNCPATCPVGQCLHLGLPPNTSCVCEPCDWCPNCGCATTGSCRWSAGSTRCAGSRPPAPSCPGRCRKSWPWTMSGTSSPCRGWNPNTTNCGSRSCATVAPTR